jgi:ABC-type transport system involved in multi-copper enzyme maturation permease subunit
MKTRRVVVWGSITVALLMAGVLILEAPRSLTVLGIIVIIGLIAGQVNTGTIAVLRVSPWARGAAMSWNELAAASGSLLGIGLGSIGIAGFLLYADPGPASRRKRAAYPPA